MTKVKLRFIFSLVIFLLTVALLPKEQCKADTFEDQENGLITLSYDNSTGVKMKLLVQVSETGYRQTYDLKSGENKLSIPLTNGNQEYTLKLCKQKEGNTYSVIETYDVTLNLKNPDEVFVYANVIVDFETTDKAVKKSNALVKKANSEQAVVNKVHEFLVENFSYDYDKASSISAGTITMYVPDVESIYQSKKGICYDYAVMLASMLRTQGLEVRVVTGYCTAVKGYHAWNQVYDSAKDEWYTVDVTYDSCYFNAGKSYSLKKSSSDYKELKYLY